MTADTHHTAIAATNGTGTRDQADRDRRDRRALADAVRLKTRLLTLSDLDRRTGAYKHANDLINQLAADLGGDDQLTTAQKQLIQRAALTGAMIEDLELKWLKGHAIDPTVHATLSNSQRRLLESLESVGLQRVPKDAMTVDQYLASTEHGNGQATGQEVVTVSARSARVNEKPTLEDWSEDNTAAEDEDTSDVENAA